MTDGNRGKSNARLRKCLDQMIAGIPVGGEILIDVVAQEFQRSDRRLWMTPSRVSHLFREREDIRRIDDGIWQKVRP